jgi:hypothetical protein
MMYHAVMDWQDPVAATLSRMNTTVERFRWINDLSPFLARLGSGEPPALVTKLRA